MTLIEQARDQYLQQPSVAKTRLKLRRQLDIAILKLLDSVRRESYGSDSELEDDTSLVKVILKWMYKGKQVNKKVSNDMYLEYKYT